METKSKSKFNAAVLNFVKRTLDDDQGINPGAFDALKDVYDAALDENNTELMQELDGVFAVARISEGRFYIPTE